MKYIAHGLNSRCHQHSTLWGLKGGFYRGVGAGIVSSFRVAGKTMTNTFSAAAIGSTFTQLGGGKFANGAITAAYVSLFNDSMHEVAGKKDLSISKQERKLAADGNRKTFWEFRLQRGDPLAQTALDIVNNQGIGRVANGIAKSGILVGGSSANLAQLGVDLMRFHVNAVDFDYANNIGLVPGSLSIDQIRDYHYQVFDNLSIPRWAFGGTPGPLGTGWTDSIYFSGCDPK